MPKNNKIWKKTIILIVAIAVLTQSNVLNLQSVIKGNIKTNATTWQGQQVDTLTNDCKVTTNETGEGMIKKQNNSLVLSVEQQSQKVKNDSQEHCIAKSQVKIDVDWPEFNRIQKIKTIQSGNLDITTTGGGEVKLQSKLKQGSLTSELSKQGLEVGTNGTATISYNNYNANRKEIWNNMTDPILVITLEAVTTGEGQATSTVKIQNLEMTRGEDTQTDTTDTDTSTDTTSTTTSQVASCPPGMVRDGNHCKDKSTLENTMQAGGILGDTTTQLIIFAIIAAVSGYLWFDKETPGGLI